VAQVAVCSENAL